MKKIVGVIPARWGSTRFPGKILAPVGGRPLLAWVVMRARQAKRLDGLLVATDDERIFEAVRGMGVEAVMTSPSHPSGTDRIAEALWGRDATAAVNIQGDEPLIEPALIDRLADVIAGGEWDMATAATPIRDADLVKRPTIVKVVSDAAGRALYFSRSVIPHDRDGTVDIAAGAPVYWRHIGVYAYRADFLQKLVKEPPCALEKLEKLEQLRALHIGGRMLVIPTEDFGIGVDVPEDVPLAEKALKRAGLI